MHYGPEASAPHMYVGELEKPSDADIKWAESVAKAHKSLLELAMKQIQSSDGHPYVQSLATHIMQCSSGELDGIKSWINLHRD